MLKKCSICTREVEEEWKYCPYCGENLEDSDEEPYDDGYEDTYDEIEPDWNS